MQPDTSFPNPTDQASPVPNFAAAPTPAPATQTQGFSNLAANSGIPTGTDSPGGSTTPEATVTTSSGGGGRRRRVIMIGVVLMLMLTGLATGTYLLTRRQLQPSFAFDCVTYTFEVDETGVVTVSNGSTRDLPAQVATVFINGQQVAEFDVPALDSGGGASLGVVPVPEDGKFDWKVTGNKDCESTGSFLPEATAQCLDVKAFDENWNPLTAQALQNYGAGDVVKFTIGGLTNRGTFDAARFTINGELMDAVTDKRPGTDEFYYEYTIPVGVTNFTVTAELMHSDAGWIGK